MEPQTDKLNLECRSNLSRLSKIYDNPGSVNTKEKKEIIKASDVYKLIGEPIQKKNNLVLFGALLDLYDSKTEALLIKGRHLKMCAEEIAFLTGLPCEGKVYHEQSVATLPTYFVNLCAKYDKYCQAGEPVSLTVMTELIKEMTIESEDDKNDFRRLFNTLTSYVLEVKSQGKIPMGCIAYCNSLDDFKNTNWPQTICDRFHSFMKEMKAVKAKTKVKKQGKRKERKTDKEKTHVTCMIQVVEAWFNMRTGRIKPQGTVCNKEGDELAPLVSYLGVQIKESDVVNVFQQIDCNEIINCRIPSCSTQEMCLDDGDEQPCSYKCSTYVLSVVAEDIIGSYLKEVLTQILMKHGYCDEAGEHFLCLTKKFNATDNSNLWQALSSQGEKIILGDALEQEKTLEMTIHNEEERGSSSDTDTAQDKDDAQKKTLEMTASNEEERGSSSDTAQDKALSSQGEKIILGDALEQEKTLEMTIHNEEERGSSSDTDTAQDKDDAQKKTLEMTASNEEERGSSSDTAQDKALSSQGEKIILGDALEQEKTLSEADTGSPPVYDGKDLVNKRIEVWWDGDKKFYAGTIIHYGPRTKKHKILYDDGEKGILNLKDETWKLLGDDEKDVADNSPHPRERIETKRKNTKRDVGKPQQQDTLKRSRR